MPSFADLLQQGADNAWLFVPSAILLGALHGLEPGHSKTMMAAFIVAIRGTVAQAGMLGVAATISHTVIVWAIALGGMYLWRGVAADSFEPWLQLVSGSIIMGMAAWMIWRVYSERRGLGLYGDDGHHHHHDHLGHSHGHSHHAHKHDDAHQRVHADDIRRRFSGRSVTNWQIAVFGLTGGLIPCPAAITVLLLCLQAKEFSLGAVLVLCFSVGLALTLVSVGVVAALSVQHAMQSSPWFSALTQRAPYLSGAMMIVVGFYIAAMGLSATADG